MRKIGIGITTFNRDKVLKQSLKFLYENTEVSDLQNLIIARDLLNDRRGVAKRKNECLQYLTERKCDYIFLFDDDCYPIQKGWIDFVIAAHEATGEHHFCFNKEPFYQIKNQVFSRGFCLESYTASGGVFMFYTKKAIETVGGFYSEYDTYGYEHLGHSMRIKKAQLTTDWFLSIRGLSDFIYARDYEEQDFFKNQSTIDITTKEQLTLKNKEICYKNDTKIYQPIIAQ